MQCVVIDSNNVVMAAVDNGNCSAYLVSQSDVIMNSVFSTQWIADNGGAELLQHAFYAGIFLPLLCYLVSYSFQSVINFLEK